MSGSHLHGVFDGIWPIAYWSMAIEPSCSETSYDTIFCDKHRPGNASHHESPRCESNDQPAALSLSAMTSQYFIGGMMPESANPVQEHQTIIEIDRIEAPSSFQVVRK